MNKTTKTFLKPYRLDWICPDCELGSMERNSNVVWLTNPPQYQYHCPSCGVLKVSDEDFPRIEYEDAD